MMRALTIAACGFALTLFANLDPSRIAHAATTPSANGERVSLGLRANGPSDAARAKMLGTLTYTRLSLTFEEVPARDAFKVIAAALNLTIVGRWSDDKSLHGIDPEAPLTMHAEARPAIDVIEELLEQCEDFEDCTWQLRAGIVEIGTKRRLSAPSARDRVTYDLTDMLLEPPQFKRDPPSTTIPKSDSPYVDAVIGESNRAAIRNGLPPPRKSKADIILELAEALVETIEPGHWDLGGRRREADPDDAQGPSSAAQQDAKQAAAIRKRRDERLWASMRSFQEALVITAPDFMHRQIGGYPRPIKPLDADAVRVVDAPPSAAEPPRPAAADNALDPDGARQDRPPKKQ